MKKNSILFTLVLVLHSCYDKVDSDVPAETRAINYWVLDVLQEVYLWEEELPTDVYPSEEPDTKNYFEKLLYEDDYWSYITDDYDGLISALDGVYKDFGFSFTLYYMYSDNQNSGDVVAAVEYVLDGTPADDANIRRGDFFNIVNGEQLTVDNYASLLNADVYRLSFVEPLDDDTYNVIEGEVEITAVVLEEDPILEYSVITSGANRVGYLMYNAFIYSTSDSAKLVDVFQYFKSEQVNDLVIDLRYNGGGATYMATQLASMIVNESNMKNNDVFYSYVYNDAYQEYFETVEGDDSPNLRVRFMDMPVNLNLNNLYVLTLDGTASASELILNALDPYMNVVQIGRVTYGKYTVSIPIQKTDSPGETWGMLPIIAKSININGVTDYVDGLTPDYYVADDYAHALGDPNEALLNVALSYIDGTVAPQNKSMQIKKSTSLDRFGGNSLISKGIMIKK